LKRRDDALATILLTSRLCASGLKPFTPKPFWKLAEKVDDKPEVLFTLNHSQLIRDRGLSKEEAKQVLKLFGRATALAFELERLEQSGIKTLTVFDDHYPHHWKERLRHRAPPLLYAAGAVDLLDKPGLGVVGSRDVSQDGGDFAEEVARTAAKRGLPLVSGGARGVDQLAMDAAIKTEGTVIGILADSLLRKLKRSDVRKAIYEGNTVLCSPYSPNAPFSAGNAMGRNKLIYAQARLTVVVASAEGKGGTWSGASEALKEGYGKVAVWRGKGEGAGNDSLEKKKAKPVSGLDDLESLLDSPDSPGARSDNPGIDNKTDMVTQPELFDGVG